MLPSGKTKVKVQGYMLYYYYVVLLSLRRLKEMCRKKNIERKRNVSDNGLREIVSNELSTPVIKVGYRQMTEAVSAKYNVNISKNDIVLKVLKELNPSDVQDRWRKLITRRLYYTNGPADCLLVCLFNLFNVGVIIYKVWNIQ